MSNTQQNSHPLSINGKPILIIKEATEFIKGVKRIEPSKAMIENIQEQITEFYKKCYSDYNALCAILNKLTDLFFRHEIATRVKPKKLRRSLTFWVTLYCIFYKKYHGINLPQAIANYYVHNTVKFIDNRERDIFITVIRQGIILPRTIAA